jgi:hypothetical protein
MTNVRLQNNYGDDVTFPQLSQEDYEWYLSQGYYPYTGELNYASSQQDATRVDPNANTMNQYPGPLDYLQSVGQVAGYPFELGLNMFFNQEDSPRQIASDTWNRSSRPSDALNLVPVAGGVGAQALKNAGLAALGEYADNGEVTPEGLLMASIFGAIGGKNEPSNVGRDLVNDILANRKKVYLENAAKMTPEEFKDWNELPNYRKYNEENSIRNLHEMMTNDLNDEGISDLMENVDDFSYDTEFFSDLSKFKDDYEGYTKTPERNSWNNNPDFDLHKLPQYEQDLYDSYNALKDVDLDDYENVIEEVNRLPNLVELSDEIDNWIEWHNEDNIKNYETLEYLTDNDQELADLFHNNALDGLTEGYGEEWPETLNFDKVYESLDIDSKELYRPKLDKKIEDLMTDLKNRNVNVDDYIDRLKAYKTKRRNGEGDIPGDELEGNNIPEFQKDYYSLLETITPKQLYMLKKNFDTKSYDNINTKNYFKDDKDFEDYLSKLEDFRTKIKKRYTDDEIIDRLVEDNDNIYQLNNELINFDFPKLEFDTDQSSNKSINTNDYQDNEYIKKYLKDALKSGKPNITYKDIQNFKHKKLLDEL